jgi:hypothetical protein
MALGTQHIILKHYLDLNLKMDGRDTVLTEVETLVKEKIELPVEAIFNEFCSEDVVMQFDKIYLDLGVINPDHLNEELLSAYCRALRHFFEQKSGWGNKLLVAGTSAYKDSEARQVTITEKVKEDILHFLKYGYWPVLSSFPGEAYDRLMLEQLEQDTSFVDRVLETISRNERAATRFVLQSIAMIQNIVRDRWKERLTVFERVNFHVLNFLLLRSSPGVDATGKNASIPFIAMPGILKQSAEMVKWIQAAGILPSQQFRHALEARFSSGYLDDDLISDEVIAFWNDVLRLFWKDAARSLPPEQVSEEANETTELNKEDSSVSNDDAPAIGKKEDPEIGAQTPSQIEKELKDQESSDSSVEKHSPGFMWEKKISSADNFLPGVKSIPDKRDSFEEGGIPDNSFFISNAGLVLLNPFLPAFFETLGLIENNAFRDAGSTQRAIHLLEYLVTGSEQPLEAGLIFNKILCGWPIEMPLSRFTKLTEIEKNEARSMLEAVIAHWTALKNSSPEALQEAFLQHSGKLTHEDDSWRLVVETKPFDMLLQQLPWTISAIKLPWMQNILFVDWV